jgi:hypothetical protein
MDGITYNKWIGRTCLNHEWNRGAGVTWENMPQPGTEQRISSTVSLSDAKSWNSSSYTRCKVKKGYLHVRVTREKVGSFCNKRK